MMRAQPLYLTQDPQYETLKEHIIASTGLVYFRDKDEDLCRRLAKRFEAVRLETCGSYLQLLTVGTAAKSEFDKLAAELTIGETYFFRHAEQFDALRKTILPDIIERNQASRRLRVWCAGCSIGAEPYSIAILLAEAFSDQVRDWDIKIIGTDINREFLARAEKAVFDEWAFRTTDAEFRNRHFTRVDKSWALKPSVRRWVEFQSHNLINDGIPNHLWGSDLVVCRNVMIYFEASTVSKIIPVFEHSLNTGGWLVIGHAEQAHGATQLKLVQLPGVTVYQKAGTAVDAFVFPSSFELKLPDQLPKTEPTRALPAPAGAGVTVEAISYLKRLADGGQFEHAIAQAAELLKKDPTNAVVYFYRALSQEQISKSRDVEADLSQAIRLDPSFVMAHYYLALFHERRGEAAKAETCFRSALHLLTGLSDEVVLPEADGITALELRTVIAKSIAKTSKSRVA